MSEALSDELIATMQRAELVALIARLEKAECWSDERGLFGRRTRWHDLRARDVDEALAHLRRLRTILESSSK